MTTKDNLEDPRPATGTGNNHAGADALAALIAELRNRDAADRRALLYIIGGFAMFTCIYSALLGTKTVEMRTGYALLVGGFIYSLGYFGVRYLLHRRIDYAAPTLLFLKRALRRYTYWPWQDILAVTPSAVAMGLGGMMIVESSFRKYFPGSVWPVVIFWAVFASAFIVGHFAGKSQWRKEKQPYYERIRGMVEEFECGGVTG